AETGRLRVRVGVIDRHRDRAPSRPESAAAHLVRVGLARDPVGEVRDTAGVARRRTPREACHGEVEAAPEEMDGAALADETGTERLQHAVRLYEHAPEALGVLRV